MAIKLSLIAKSKGQPEPYGLLALAYYLESLKTAEKVNVEWVFKGDPVALDIDGTVTLGSSAVIAKLGDLYASQGSVGSNAGSSALATQLLLLQPPFPPTFPASTSFLTSLEQHLTLRTYLVSHSPSLVDYILWGSLRVNTIARAQLGSFPHVGRWYNHISLLDPALKAEEELGVQVKVKAPKEEKVSKEDKDKANATFELGLPNAKMGEVVTRFPPEPSGYLHVGHAKAAILNQYFASHYQGRFLVRFDDTNPSKEKAEFEESIIEDMALLGIKGEKITYTSDYFDQLHEYCVRMIKEGNAYADDTDQETMRKYRWDGIASVRRSLPVDESLAKFALMATGSEEGQKWCIRAKMSVDDPNKAMRDPVIYRGNPLPHHRTGTKFKVYPTYDFACPIVDCLEGVTHALRTNEYRDRNPQYHWMLNALGLRKVEIWDYGRINFVYTLLSKRKLKWFVEEGLVRGWDDPRFPTVRGIRRRGMTISAITQYMLLQGPSQAFTNLEWDVIWNINKKVIDPIAPRHVALEKENLVKVNLTGTGTPTAPESREAAKHKKNPEVGTKMTTYDSVVYVDQKDAKGFALGEEITLMEWGNAFVRSINYSSTSPTIIESLDMELNLTGDFKKTKQKITWLSSSPSIPLLPCTLYDYDYLITKKKLEETDEVKDLLTPQTEFATEALCDANVKTYKKGDIIQFERVGFFIVDKAWGEETTDPGRKSEKEKIELILIPDGRVASVVSKYAAAKEAEEKAKGPVAKEGKKEKAKKEKAPAKPKGLPDVAPNEAIETILLSEGSKGFAQPVKTKMFKVDSHYGEVNPPVKTEMYEVKSIYQD
ncbi:glutamyl-tRNA synthetase [Meredithblackwellia eburnea MCA 4105]